MGCGGSKTLDLLKPAMNLPDTGINLPTGLKLDIALPNIAIPGSDLLEQGKILSRVIYKT